MREERKRAEPAVDLGLILSANKTHELRHAVAMIPRRAESVVLDLPSKEEG